MDIRQVFGTWVEGSNPSGVTLNNYSPNYGIVLDYKRMCEEAIKLTDGLELAPFKPQNIVFAGMGGSGISGDLVRDVATGIRVPIGISKDSDLPAYADSETLVVCTSYSGNTNETLSQFVGAYKRGCRIVAITSGGKLLEWSQRLNVPFVKLPAGYMPRDSLPYLFFSVTGCMERMGIGNYADGAREFLELLPTISLSPVDDIADSVKDSSMLILYGPSEFSGVLKRVKSQINENAKMLAKVEELPELNHNELVGYEVHKYPEFPVIFLRDRDETLEMAERVKFSRETKGGNLYDIWTYGNSKLAKVMSLVYQGDHLTFRLAELRGVNRQQTLTIDSLKERMKGLGIVEGLEKELGFIS